MFTVFAMGRHAKNTYCTYKTREVTGLVGWDQRPTVVRASQPGKALLGSERLFNFSGEERAPPDQKGTVHTVFVGGYIRTVGTVDTAY